MGDACERVVRSWHDVQEAAGYVGFFDIDSTEEIDRTLTVNAGCHAGRDGAVGVMLLRVGHGGSQRCRDQEHGGLAGA